MLKRLLLSITAFCLLFLSAPRADASPHRAQSELVQKSLLYQRTMTPPQGTSLSQRALLAVNVAAADLGVQDPVEFRTAYDAALALDNYKPISDTTWSWITDHWEYAIRSTYTYNEDGLPTEVISEQWDGHEWDLFARLSFSYDGNGRQDTMTTQFWASTVWENASRTYFTYSGGDMMDAISQTWDAFGMEWKSQSRLTTEFVSGMIDSETSYLWDTDHWSLSGVTSYTYNAQGLVEEILTQYDFGGGLMNTSRTTSTFDGNWNETQTLLENWGGSDWIPSSRLTRTFNGSNQEVLLVKENWFGISYTTISNDTTRYNVDGRVSEVVHVELFFSSDVSRTLYMYDDNSMSETVVEQYWNPALQAAPMAEWTNDSKTITIYNEFATSVQLDANPHSPHYELGQNFPNPFNPTTVIHFSLPRGADVEISIYNLLGQQVTTLENGYYAPGVYETTWDGTDAAGRSVPSGVYFYRLTTDTQVETRKMLLLK